MTTNDFKASRASVPPEVQKELYSLFSTNPDAARQRMVELAAEQGVIDLDQVRTFLTQMNEESEFDDIELIRLPTAIAGGQGGGGREPTDDNSQRLLQLRFSSR